MDVRNKQTNNKTKQTKTARTATFRTAEIRGRPLKFPKAPTGGWQSHHGDATGHELLNSHPGS